MEHDPTQVHPDTHIHGLDLAIAWFQAQGAAVYDNHAHFGRYNVVGALIGGRRDGLTGLELIALANALQQQNEAEHK